MKEIKLTRGLVALVDDQDYEELNKYKWQAQPSHGTYYATRSSQRKIDGKRDQIRMHRVVIGITDSSILVDHKDQNGLNNQRSNLRCVDIKQSNYNKKGHNGSKSKYKGVSWYSRNKKWGVRLRLNGTQKFYGLYDTEEQAAKRYDEIAVINFKEFAHLNFKP